MSGIRPYGSYVDDSCIAYYDSSIEGSILRDRSKYNNSGTYNGIALANGRNGKALSFDGIDDYAIVPNFNQIIKTVSLWIKVSSIPSDSRIIFVHLPSQAGLGFYQGSSFILKSGNTTQRTSSLSNFQVNTWNHIAITYDAAGIPTIRINGIEPTYTSPQSWTVTVDPLYIGARSTGGNCACIIDKFIAYDRVLSSEEILQHYQEGVITLRRTEGKFGGCIAVEEGTTNIQNGLEPWANNGGLNFDVTGTNEAGPIQNAKTWKFVKTGTSSQWNGWESDHGGIFDLAIGESLTISGYYKTSDAIVSEFGMGLIFLPNWSRAYSTTETNKVNNIVADGLWHKFSCTITANETITDGIIADGPSWGYSTQAGTLYINGLQWEKKPFATSFTNGSRHAGKLYYPKELFNPASFTISCWFNIPYMHRTDAGHAGIVGEWYHPIIEVCPISNMGSAGYSICAGPEPASFNRKILLRAPGQIMPANAIPIQDNTWYHLGATYDGTIYRVYINGREEVNYISSTAPIIYDDTVIMVGGGYFGSPNILIDELRIDKVSRTAQEIEQWRLAGAPFYPRGGSRICY